MTWTLDFFRRMTKHMTVASAARLRGMVLRDDGRRPPRPGVVRIRMKPPFGGNIWLREPGSDVETFFEVVVHEIYRRSVELAPGAEYVVDLGGNIGLTTRYFAGRFPTCRVVTVEPSADSYQLLCRNVAAIPAGRCQAVHGAVWGEDSASITVGLPPEGGKHHAIRVEPGEGASGATVPGYSMKTLIEKAGFPRVDILKIDIEGSETAVFRGDTSWLASVGVITIEFHGSSRADSGFDEVVRQHGFEVRDDDFPNTALAARTRPASAD